MVDKSLTDDEVLKVAGPGTRVFPYPKIEEMNHINELVDEKNGFPNAIILYQFKDDPKTNSIMGHWTAVKSMKGGSKLVYFDSYGKTIDQPLNVMPEDYRIKSNQVQKKLSELIGDSQFNDIHYSQYPLQEHKKGINTCGRWASYFCNLGLDSDRFYELMKQAKKDLHYKSYDKMIVDLTNNLL